ncbi:disulfide bond formation protein DsbA [Nonomuraea sp. NPDC050663]|uniref:mycothiol-dependent nitroreductase Rv2466c family protein n=1 Tax=Nonomuraea sp. NPDC050663 TaxID=3364370 RepID=UPI0037A8800A
MPNHVTVDFWLDPSCPYTWNASRWLLEVTRVRPVTVRWQLLSLSALNEHLEVDPEGDTEGYLWYPARVCAAVELEHGKEALGAFYSAYGKRDDWDFAAALTEAGLPAELAERAGDTTLDDFLRASTARGIDRVGPHVGTPIVAAGQVAFFGPVISEIPSGEAAGRLWDGLLLVAGTPGFHELKGSPAPEDP